MSLDDKRYKNVSTSWGDADPTFRVDGADNDSNFKSDSAGFPSEGFIGNKFDGTGNPNMGESTDMDMNLAPNKFPRETGQVTITEEEALLT